jgi:hypothetical protein
MPLRSGTVLFQDDFASPASGWSTFADPSTQAAYLDGSYVLLVRSPDNLALGRPGFELADVRLAVDATASGPSDNAFGLICRYQDPDNFIFFLISSDGYSGIGEVRDGQRSLLTGKAMLPSDLILQGAGPNHLEAECNGAMLALRINGDVANQAVAPDRASGDVGVLAGSYAEGGVEVRFDNFTIVQP